MSDKPARTWRVRIDELVTATSKEAAKQALMDRIQEGEVDLIVSTWPSPHRPVS